MAGFCTEKWGSRIMGLRDSAEGWLVAASGARDPPGYASQGSLGNPLWTGLWLSISLRGLGEMHRVYS